MNNAFPIFKPNDSVLIFTKGHALFLFLVLFIVLKTTIAPENGIVTIVTMLLFLICMAFHITKSFRYKKLDGEFTGELIFNENHLFINDLKIEVADIEKIFIRANDYDGFITGSNRAFQNNKSNGTNNLLDIVTNDNHKIKVFFQMNFMQQEEMLPFVHSLIKLHSIPFEYGSEIESVNEYYRFKRTS